MLELTSTGPTGVDDRLLYRLYPRPTKRSECAEVERPCPYVSCRYHLYLDVDPVTGVLKIRFPEIEPGEMKDSCALDIAEEGEHTLDEIAAYMGLTRERIRQVELRSLMQVRLNAPPELTEDD